MAEPQKKKDDRGNVKLPSHLHKALSHYAIEEEISLADVVRRGWEALSAQTVPPIHSLLSANVRNLSPGDLEWLRRLVGVAVERLNATDKEDERSGNDPLADPDKRIAALRTEADRIDEATKKLQRSPAPDTGTERRPGKRGGGASKPPGGGGRD